MFDNNENKKIKYYPNIEMGLTTEEVKERQLKGQVHHNTEIPTKSIKQIIWDNLFTLFNILNFGLGISILLVGSYKNLLFLGVVVCNILISVLQEIKAKKTVDKLSLFSETKVEVIRDGKSTILHAHEIVLDDIIKFNLGNQILVDSLVLRGDCLVNEALITGEDTPIRKRIGDHLLSGSFIVSGSVTAVVEHVGEDNYTSKISKDAKYLKKLNSELMHSLETIVKILSIVIIPVGLLIFWGQMRIPNIEIGNAIVQTTAALIGMIPDGLVLLTSTVLAVSVIRLGKYNVLVQELYCIETLARVDVLCLDKTGTITEGKMELKDLIPVNGYTKEDMGIILGEISYALNDNTPTMEAIRTLYKGTGLWKLIDKEDFSSDVKYSKVSFDQGDFILGAPEYINKSKKFLVDCSLYEENYRVLLLAKIDDKMGIKEIGYLLIQDKVRMEAINTLKYFKEQGVSIKIISGDNPHTVSHIAKRVGVLNADKFIDVTGFDLQQLNSAALEYTVFGRVSPSQKKELIKALKNNEHVVAYLGDGVNDVLALKEADCSITIGDSSGAAKNVSQLVLLDSNFAGLPHIVEEGRRTINNIERSASLFLVKTIYTTLLVVLFFFVALPYPFVPIQLSLTNMVTIGIPSFILALEVNRDRVKGSFLKNVIGKALPSAFVIFTSIIIILIFKPIFILSESEISTLAVLLVAVIGFSHLYRISRPLNKTRGILLGVMIITFLTEIFFLRNLFSLAKFSWKLGGLFLALSVFSIVLYQIYDTLFSKIYILYLKFKQKKRK